MAMPTRRAVAALRRVGMAMQPWARGSSAAPLMSSSWSSSFSSASSSPASSPSPSSVSPDEVAHFNGLAATWWDPHGSSRLLHQMNPLRHDFLRACLAATGDAPPARLLDIGCGGGIFAESAARLPTTTAVTAIDPSAAVLAVARAHARRDPLLRRTLTYVQSAVEDVQLPTAPDMVTLFEVLEHVATSPGAFLATCGRLLRPGGWLVGSTMARTWTSWLTTIVAAEDVLGIVPPGTHDWQKYVNADELAAHFAPGGAACADGTVWEHFTLQGVAYVPLLGWQVVPRGEMLGNYFFAVRKADSPAVAPMVTPMVAPTSGPTEKTDQ